jgi:hypothetical protein
MSKNIVVLSVVKENKTGCEYRGEGNNVLAR